MIDNWVHLRRAALVLVGPGPVKQRLCEAYLTHLQQVDPNSLPRDLQGHYAALSSAMHCARPAGGLGEVEASVRKMSDLDAGRLAEQVLCLYVSLAGGDSAEPAVAASRPFRLVGDDDEIPAFLNRA
jgi:hypothetical protein